MKNVLRALAALAVGAVTLAVPAGPSFAFEGEPIVIDAKEGAAVSKDYGPMPAPDTAGALAHPGDCAIAPTCTEIPLTVNLPADFDPDFDEFFFNFKVEWEGNVVVAGTAGTQDLDIYIYTLRPNEEGEEEYVEVGRAASADQPEQTRLFMFTEGEYVIIVQNFNGVNTGFRVSLDFEDASIDPNFDPFEGTDRPAGRGSGSGSSVSPGSGSGSGGESGSSPSGGGGSASLDLNPTGPAPTSPASLSPVGSDGFGVGFTATPGDAGLGDFGSFNQFQKDLNAEAQPSTLDLLAASRRQLGPPEDVGAPVLFFWLLALPVVFGAGALVLLARRRPAALTVSV